MKEVYGLTSKGFKPKEFVAIKEEIQNTLKAEVDPYLHFGPDSVAGVLVDIIANQSRQVWESLAGLYNSLNPQVAHGRSLDALCSLTGTYRKSASVSKANAIFTLDANTMLPKNSRIKTIAGDFFITTKDIKNESTERADIQGELVATNSGPKIAFDKTVAEIMTPVAGWVSCQIVNTYYIGTLDETDDELRVRRLLELRGTGSATFDAVKARLLQLTGVEAVHIKENEYSFEAIVKGGDEREIAATIWQCKPLGVRSSGHIKMTVTDSFKKEKNVYFSRPTIINLTLHVSLKVKKQFDETFLKTNLAQFARKHFNLGSEVYPSRFYAAILEHKEVLDITSLQIRERTSGKLAPSEIKEDEIASLSISDIYIEQQLESSL